MRVFSSRRGGAQELAGEAQHDAVDRSGVVLARGGGRSLLFPRAAAVGGAVL